MLEPHRDRVTWDAIIHSVEDIEALPWAPRTVNVKPSRFGSVERLFAAYDYCEANGIGAYGGGQWELGPGRGHIQLLAALNHPDTPNDVAPREFNLDPQPGLPESPLTWNRAPRVCWPCRRAYSDRSQQLRRPGSAAATRASRCRGLRARARPCATVRSSGASTMFTKSYSPSAAHWWSTFRAHLLDVAVDLTQAVGIRVEGLDPLLRESRQHQVRGHRAPFLARARA